MPNRSLFSHKSCQTFMKFVKDILLRRELYGNCTVNDWAMMIEGVDRQGLFVMTSRYSMFS